MKRIYFFWVICFGLGLNAQVINFPDANFKAKLLQASSSNLIASIESIASDGTVSTYNAIDTNGNGEIEINEASVIKYLNISFTNIDSVEGINYFTNLESLSCHHNDLVSLNVSSLVNLKRLYCENNQLQNINVTNLINLQILLCYNNLLTSVNLSGLTNLVTLDFYSNLLSTLDVSGLTNLQTLWCVNNQLTSLDVSGLNNLEYLYCSSNQLTSISFNGISNLKTLYCSYNQLQSLNVSSLANLQTLDCSGNQLTSLFIKNGNTSWTNLSFGNNLELDYVCVDDEDVNMVQQKCITYGNTNCEVNTYCGFMPGGNYFSIEGYNKYNENNNGCLASNPIYPNLKFNVSNGIVSWTQMADSSGNYAVSVQQGTHTITPQPENPNYFTVSPPTMTVDFPLSPSPFLQNFCLIPNGVHHDLEIKIIPLFFARPGYDAIYKIKYRNKGNSIENASVEFNFDDTVQDFVSSSLIPTTQGIGTLGWNIGTIAPFQSGEIFLVFNINSPMDSPAINAGNILSYSAQINGQNGDETEDDNSFTLHQEVLNSCDPNDKRCLDGTTIDPSLIGEYIHYNIRFENTGTANAQNIVVKDMIDTSKFDIATLVPIDGSHSFVTRITNTNQVEFIFENIQLPFDNDNNDGYVAFKIKTKPTLTTGSSFSNTASIYFDYNFPIVTNTATTTIQALANQDFEFSNYFELAPNPAQNIVQIRSKNDVELSSISIYNTLRQLVLVVPNAKTMSSIDVSQLTSGTYFIKVISDKGSSNTKFIKE